MHKQMIRDLLTYGVGRSLPAALSMIFTLGCVQNLSSEQYARYSLGVLPALVAAAFVGGLASQPLLRFGTRIDRGDLPQALLSVPLLGALASTPLVLAWWATQNMNWTALLPLSLLLVPAIAITDARRSFFVASSKPMAVLHLDSIRTLASLALLWLLFHTTTTAEAVPIAAMLCGAVLALMAVRLNLPCQQQGTPVKVDRAYLGYGVWAACWMALITMFPLAERHILQLAHGLDAVGIYSAISDPTLTLMAAGTSVVVSTVSPKLVAAWDAGNRTLVSGLTRTGVLAATGLAMTAWLAGAIAASLQIGRLGWLLHEFPILATAMLVVTAAWQFAVFVHKPLEMMRRVDLMFGSLLLAGLVFVGTALLLVGPLQGLGLLVAKAASLLAYIVFVKAAINFLNRGAL